MRRPLTAAGLLALLSAVTLAWRGPFPDGAKSDLRGAWIATGWAVGGTPTATPQRGLMIFTGDHYSFMFVNGDQPRAEYTGASMTDAEMLAAYRSFIANTGRYVVQGDTIVTKAFMAKDPNYMAAWDDSCVHGPCKSDVTLTFTVTGDELRLAWPSNAGVGTGLVGTFHRIE
jgi:hypothetical protein